MKTATTSQKTELLYVGPKEFIKRKFEQSLENMSPQFCKIYNQAMGAESYGLDEIAGIGYRKSLEFLVKDFLIHKDPDSKEKITCSFIGTLINNGNVPQNIKTSASRCIWLGNDHAHYLAKHTDKDLGDLKRLLDATVYWVMMELTTEEAEAIEPIK